MPARISRAGVQPITSEPLPAVCFGLLVQVTSYELLKVEAVVHGDCEDAWQDLLAHPLGPRADKI
jgi:6-phospho-beta-glucosidase